MTQHPAGWYPNPEKPDQIRWWDGSHWTEHVQIVPTPRMPHADARPSQSNHPVSANQTPQQRLTSLLLSIGFVAAGLVGGLAPWTLTFNNALEQPRTFASLDSDLECGAPWSLSQHWVPVDGTSCAGVYLGMGGLSVALLISGVVFFVRWLYMMVGRDK